jgi:phosphoribosyl-AMP cyclohydrolase / phosphoribosyl-ATP pyrophosphohydrolase
MLRSAMELPGLKWDSAGLVTVVVQDQETGEIRMLAHANSEAVQATLSSGFAHFFSRSRGQLWRKGESSGHGLRVSQIWVDCDGDALVYLATPEGPSCHTLRETCFFKQLSPTGELIEDAEHHAQSTLPRLWSELEARRKSTATKSYTKSLLEGGPAKINAKIAEESAELTKAIESETPDRVASEAADVLYHVLVGLMSRDVTLRDVEQALSERFKQSGHEEKASRSK